MNENQTVQCFLSSPSQTDRLGILLAQHISPGNLVLLNGTLGAGKSALARATIRSLLSQPNLDVPSPTFLLVLPYGDEKISILHADLYRLKGEEELDELGLFEDAGAITFVEWSQRAPHLAKQADMIIDLKFLPEKTGRVAYLSSPIGSTIIEALSQDPFFQDHLS